MSDAWDRRRQTLLLGADALDGHDLEKWSKFEDAFTQLPRTLAPQELDYDRSQAAERFRTRQTEEPDNLFPLPFAGLNDALLGGLGPGDVCIIAADGKAGKSMLLDMALESAFKAGGRGRLYLSEMSPPKREARWIQRHTKGRIRMGRVLRKELSPEEVDEVAGMLDKHFPWDATKAFGKGFSEVAEMIVRHRPDVVACDVLTKFHYNGQRDLAHGVTLLHAAAESVGAPLILATHLSRAGIDNETGIRRTPTPHDIMDASAVANFADVVLLIHRPWRIENGKATGEYLDNAKLLAPYVRDGEAVKLPMEWNADHLAWEVPEEQAVLA